MSTCHLYAEKPDSSNYLGFFGVISRTDKLTQTEYELTIAMRTILPWVYKIIIMSHNKIQGGTGMPVNISTTRS